MLALLNVMAFVSLVTSWFGITEIQDKSRARMSQIFNNMRLVHYSCHQDGSFDNGDKFQKYFLPLQRDFSIKSTLIIILKTQANDIVQEQVH